MTFAKGSNSRISFVKENQWGVTPDIQDVEVKNLRRVNLEMNLQKDMYETSEISSTRQVSNYVSGTRSVTGKLQAELISGEYTELLANCLESNIAQGIVIENITISLIVNANTVTLSSTTDFVAAGLKVGNVVRLYGSLLDTVNTDNNLVIISLSANSFTAISSSSVDFVNQSSISKCYIVVVGNTLHIPTTNHVDDSFTLARYQEDIATAEVFNGVKTSAFSVNISADSFATLDIDLLGKDVYEVQSNVLQATTTTNTSNPLTVLNGVVISDGIPVANVQSINFFVDRSSELLKANFNRSVVGIESGHIRIAGTLTFVVDENTNLRAAFDKERDISLIISATSGNEKNSNIMSFTFPKIRFGAFSKNDSIGILSITAKFIALLGNADQSYYYSSLYVQDVNNFQYTLPKLGFAGVLFGFTRNGQGVSIGSFKRSSDSFQQLQNLTATDTSTTIKQLSVSQDGDLLVVSSSSTAYLDLYKRNEETFNKTQRLLSISSDSSCISPDGMFIVSCRGNSPYVSVFKNDGNGNFTNVTSTVFDVQVAISASYCEFSKDGKYLAIGLLASPRLHIYERIGDLFIRQSIASPTIIARKVKWSNNNMLITDLSFNLSIYEYTTGLPVKVQDLSFSSSIRDFSISEDSKYIVVTAGIAPYVFLYKKQGSLFVKQNTTSFPSSYNGISVSFDPTGTYISIGVSGVPYVRMLKLLNDNLVEIASTDIQKFSGLGISNCSATTWMPFTE